MTALPVEFGCDDSDDPPARPTSAGPIVVHVDQVAAIPMTLFMRSCKLTIGAEEIRCVRKTGVVVFHGHPSDFHSYAEFLGAGFHLWHGTKRYRFVHWAPYANDGDVVPKSEEALRPIIATRPPNGVRVKPPMTFQAAMWASVAWSVAAALVVAAVIVTVGYFMDR
jgi:hypothetical protein